MKYDQNSSENNDWKQCYLEDILEFQRGFDLPKSKMIPGPYPVIGSNGIIGYHHEFTTNSPSVSIGRSGNVGNPFIYFGKSWCHNTTLFVKKFKCDPLFSYYLLKTIPLYKYSGGSAVPTLNRNHIKRIPIRIPVSIEKQQKISNFLHQFDRMIELNNKIIETIELMLIQIFKSYTTIKGASLRQLKASDVCNITIGKTPPRKIKECFSKNPNDVEWVSISDMGRSNIFINSTSERLTKESISNYNVKIVPDGTILLSFKLTIGRVRIADGEMATNEAIAHFHIDDESLREYLYCYLRTFNYDSLGNTSSIATAVNSRVIKAMPIKLLSSSDLSSFHKTTAPLMAKIKLLSKQNKTLSSMRDVLIPKLLSRNLN